MKILHKTTGKVLFEDNQDTIKKTVEAAVKVGTSLDGASLDGASLNRAWLSGASLNGSSLNGASLNGAWLNGASLNGSSLNRASLNRASLDGASLNGASLNGASLNGARLNRSSLNGSSLNGASLNRAWLNGASLDAKTIDMFTIAPTGKLIVWKKLGGGSDTIARLEIPEKAGRVGGLTGRKCRAEYAKVISGKGCSQHDPEFKYAPGKIVRPDKWDPDPRVECSSGIHFFLTKSEAEAW